MSISTPSTNVDQTTGNTSNHESIDFEVLRSFDEPDSPVEESLMIELIDLYLVETSRLLESIREAIEETQLDSVKLKAHSLKGSSANLGITLMASLSERLEHFQPGEATRLELLGELEYEFTRVSHLLTEERGRRSDENTDR
jgi:HPt (histidine-containing phosphotransfer) domain-containing protein